MGFEGNAKKGAVDTTPCIWCGNDETVLIQSSPKDKHAKKINGHSLIGCPRCGRLTLIDRT